MTIFSIGDLHLSLGDKPMDIFGDQWAGHVSRIEADWRARVEDEDVVLLPGDLSWAMQLDEAIPHINFVGSLPGRKIIIKGNHDYWWTSISRLRNLLPEGLYAIQNDCVFLDGVLFAGSRGWSLPYQAMDDADRKIFDREVMRLEMSLKAARKLSSQAPIICMTHFPPLAPGAMDTPVTRVVEQYGVSVLVYGHLHGASLKNAFNSIHNQVSYRCVSCDGLGFKLAEIYTI